MPNDNIHGIDQARIDHVRKHHGEAAGDRAAERAHAAVDARAPRLGDRFGRPLRVGDRVLHQPTIMPVFCDVLDVQRVFDPKMPPDLIRVVLGTTFDITLRESQIATSITQVFDVDTIMQLEAELARQQEALRVGTPPASPPPGPTIILTDADPVGTPPPPAAAEAPPAEKPAEGATAELLVADAVQPAEPAKLEAVPGVSETPGTKDQGDGIF